MDHVKNAIGFRPPLSMYRQRNSRPHPRLITVLMLLKLDRTFTRIFGQIKKYCEADVIVTKEVYDYGLKIAS